MEKRRQQFEHSPLLLDTDTDGRQGGLGRPELLSIVDTVDGSGRWATLLQVVELRDIGVQTQILTLLRRCASTELVEDVVVPFRQRLEDNTRAFQQVCSDTRANNLLLAVEENLMIGREAWTRVTRGVSRTWMYLPKRDELSFLVVFALPKASSTGFVARI